MATSNSTPIYTTLTDVTRVDLEYKAAVDHTAIFVRHLLHLCIYARARSAPAEADLQRRFDLSPPAVHQMVLALERAGLIRRKPGVARSIEVLVAPELLPVLR